MSDSTHEQQARSWFEKRVPEMTATWHEFHESVYETATLERSVQELIAAASGAILRCRHCTRSHVEKAREEGASKEEISEALMVAALMGSGTQLFWMKDDYEELLGETAGTVSSDSNGAPAERSDAASGAPWFHAHTEEMGKKWLAFHEEMYEPSVLDRTAKELVAVACGALLRCRHCTRTHIEKARAHGAEKSHVSETLMTASLIASSSQLAWMMEDYEELLG